MRSVRLLVAAALLGACTGTPSAPLASDGATPDSRASATSPVPAPTVTTPVEDPTVAAREVLTDVDRAATTDPTELRVAVATAMGGDLAGLVVDAWEDRVLEGLPGWPVVTGRAQLGLDGSVDLDVVLATPPDEDGDLVLRWLPSAPALGDAVGALTVEVGGVEVEVEVDEGGARLVVPVEPGPDHLVRVRASYTVPAREVIVDDGTPAGYGLLASTGGAVMLGHWLPLVALPGDDGPMQARGDVGAFPPAAFSLVVQHEGSLVTGGTERDCPTPAPTCTWVQGVGLRDVSAVLLADPVTASADVATVHAPSTSPAGRLQEVAEESDDGLAVLADALAPLPWTEVDVVAAPISPGAAGMEFPGMVWVDPTAWPEPGPEFGSYVLAHELGHQWFHALVGNGSLSAPVVDESLAQYLSVVLFDRLFGPREGASLAARSLGGRHDRAVEDGLPDEPPAQPLAAFDSARSYGANVYGRGGQAWVTAEVAAGRDAVLEALRVLVARYGLREVDEEVVLDIVREVAPAAVDPLVAGWGVD